MTATTMTRRRALAGALGLGLAPALPAAEAEGAARTVRALTRPALKVARPTQAVLQAVALAGTRLVAVGERGLVIHSDDAGQRWTQARVPLSASLTALCFADAKRGWAVGNLGVVLQTDDGGATWVKRLDGSAGAALALQAAQGQPAQVDEAQRLVDEGPDKPLLAIAQRPDGALLAVGAYGLAFASRDGGTSWQPQMARLPNAEGLTYYGLAERRGEALLFGEQGLLLRSTGEAFAATPSPANASLFAAVAQREGPLLLMGLRGRVWRSAAPGDAWQLVQTPVDASLLGGTVLADGRVVVVGAAGQVLLSADGGQHFRPVALAQRFPFTGVVQAPDGALLLVGLRGLLRVTPAELTAALESGLPSSPRKPAA
jgi:photosystem II stability/assembly factor-like uncharacterized protein